MDADGSKTILEQALFRLLNEDLATFGGTIGERSLMFRMAHYMASEAEREGLTVDCEYNRHIDGAKEFRPKTEDGNPQKSRFSPDIVLHHRRNDEQNVLVCELKKASDNRDPDIDKGRLKQLTRPDGDFRYRLGAFIKIDQAERIIRVTYFEGGELSSKEDVVMKGMKTRNSGLSS